MENRKCKACEFTQGIHREAIENEVNRLRGMKGVKTLDEEEQLRRLGICGECGSLDMNGVCMMCGCYAVIRTLVRDNRCPMGRWK